MSELLLLILSIIVGSIVLPIVFNLTSKTGNRLSWESFDIASELYIEAVVLNASIGLERVATASPSGYDSIVAIVLLFGALIISIGMLGLSRMTEHHGCMRYLVLPIMAMLVLGISLYTWYAQ